MSNRDIGDPWARRPEQPRAEPEIIPPGAPDPRRQSDRSRIWISVGTMGGSQRIHIARPTPLAIAMTLLALGFATAAVLVLFLGAFLLALPVAGLLAGGAIIAGLLRGSTRRLR